MAGAGLARVDADGRLTWANPAFAAVLGGATGTPLSSLLAPVAPADATARLAAGETVALRRADGRRALLAMAEGDAGESILALTVDDAEPAQAQAQAESAFPANTATLTTMFDAMSDGVSAFDADMRLVVWNRRYLELFRLPPDVARAGSRLDDIIRFNIARGDYGPGDADAIVRGRVALCGRAEPFAYRLARVDGSILDVRHTPLPGGGFLRVYTDVTDRARSDEAQGQIMDAISVPLIVTRLSDGMVLAGNQPSEELFGVHIHEAVGVIHAADYYTDSSDRERMLEALKTGDGRVDGYETRLQAAGGQSLWVMLSARVFRYQGEPALLTCVADITARKRAEEALEAQWTQTGAVLDGLSQGVLAFDRDGRLVAWNRRAIDLLGIAPGVLRFHLPFDDIVRHIALTGGYGRGLLEDIAVARRDAAAESGDIAHGEHVRPDGLVIERLSHPLPDGGFVATCTDVTERRHAERELAASRELFELAIRAAREGISQWDLGRDRLWFSPQWWALLGYGEEEMVNTRERWAELILPEDRAATLRMVANFASGAIEECQLLQRYRHKQGHTVCLFTRSIRVAGADGRAFRVVGSHTDVTERVRAEERANAARDEAERALHDLKEAQAHLIQSEKMAALGSLVAGVAHEINTPVGIALTGASLLAERTRMIRRDFESGTLRRPDFADFLDTAAEATQLMLLNIDRAAQLIQSFKQIAVDQASEERRAFDLSDYLHEVLRSLGVRIKRAAHQVEVDCPEGMIVDGYPGALSQVLTNFVINSIVHGYADGDHGTLSVSVRPVGGDEVELVYADDGRGIPAELHGKVFEPFFTTNRGSGGSGLGLNIVYNIVTRTLRGRLALDSAPGHGTRFTLRFPRVAPRPEAANT